ncbi:hypothetical protein L218DRAFT_949511 [Marasmius fiardii PR-910]|nr:hypothetical protein L218DRAFT_949511 [Marasmius fiardii PR-910]
MISPKLFITFTIFAVTTTVNAASGVPDPIPPSACISPRTIECCRVVRNIHDLPIKTVQTLGTLLPLPDVDPFVGMTCTHVSSEATSCKVIQEGRFVVDCLRVGF